MLSYSPTHREALRQSTTHTHIWKHTYVETRCRATQTATAGRWSSAESWAASKCAFLHIRPMPLPHRQCFAFYSLFYFALAVVVNVVDAFATKLVGFFVNFRAACTMTLNAAVSEATGWALDWRNALSAAVGDVCKFTCMHACVCVSVIVQNRKSKKITKSSPIKFFCLFAFCVTHTNALVRIRNAHAHK